MSTLIDDKHRLQMDAVLSGVPQVRKLADGWNATVARRKGPPMVRVCSSWSQAMKEACNEGS